jgi:DNA-binding PadR family transcriptional regulator
MLPDTDVESALPLSESTFLILLSLAQGPQHGYGIMKTAASLSEGRVHLSTGTLYGAIKRLLAQGWIERAEEDSEPEADGQTTGRPRTPYVLTDLGRRVLNAEVARLQALVAIADLRGAQAPS